MTPHLKVKENACINFVFLYREKFLVCPMKHAAVAMDIDGSHKLVPLDEDVSVLSYEQSL